MQPSANMKPRPELHQVGAQRHQAHDVEGRRDLAGAADLDLVAQVQADQRVVDEQQPLLQWRADIVGEFERRRARAAFGAVDDDEVRRDAGLQHGLGQCEPFPGMADAELEARRLAARQRAAAAR